jgi:hypothetical protein
MLCRRFCKSEGLAKALAASVDYWSQVVYIKASLLLHLFLVQRCENSLSLEKYNFTFFGNVVAAVTR